MSKRAEQAAGKIHNRALLEAEKYATSHGRSIVEEVAFGRGFKAGFIKGYEQAEKDIKELIQYKIDSIGNNRERGYWLDAASELSDIIDMIDG